MKIGFVRRGFSGTGGAESYLRRLAYATTMAGHEGVILASREWPKDIWPEAQIAHVAGKSPRSFADALARSAEAASCDCLFSLERVWHCDYYRAGDGVHRSWLKRWNTVEPCWRKWGRVFNSKHREILELESRLFTPEGAKAVIANSRMVKEDILAHYPYPPENIHVIYNGIPAPKEIPDGLRAQTRAELGIPEDCYVVLFAGSGWKRKGLRYALEGMKQAALPRSLLLVAGRGNARPFRNEANVHFAGPVHGMRAFYAAADAFILPTLYDPFSNACLEALARGLPVITTRSNGFSEIIQPGVEGELLDDPTDAEAVACAIKAWSDPDRRAAIRPRLEQLAAQYSMERNFNATMAAITGQPCLPCSP